MLENFVRLHVQQLQTQQQQSSNIQNSCMQPALADPKHPEALFIDRDGSHFSYILGYLRNADHAALPPDLHTTQLVVLEAQYYQLTGLIELLQKHEAQLQQHDAQLKQSKHDKQQQVLTQAAATQQLLAEVAKGIAGIKQYVSPRCFKHQTICEFSRYDDEYPGDCEPECNLVADREAALHGVLDKQLPTVVRKLGGAPVQACAAGCLLEA